MRIGRLNIPFLLQSQSLVPDGEGSTIAQWSTLAAMWGSLEDIGGKGLSISDGVATHKIVVRTRHDVAFTTAQRLVHNDQSFHIVKISPDDKQRQWIRLYVAEVGYLN